MQDGQENGVIWLFETGLGQEATKSQADVLEPQTCILAHLKFLFAFKFRGGRRWDWLDTKPGGHVH